MLGLNYEQSKITNYYVQKIEDKMMEIKEEFLQIVGVTNKEHNINSRIEKY